MTTILFCLAFALSASPASAKKKSKQTPRFGPVVTVTTVGNTASATGQFSSATATCPAGKRVVGGGFSAPVSTTNAIVVDQSFRSSSQAWTVSGLHTGGSGAVTAHAYCRAGGKAITDASAIAPVPPTAGGVIGAGTAIATCPKGSALIGGGFESTRGPGPSDSTVPQTNIGDSAGSWTSTSVNITAVAQTMIAHAYCVAGMKRATLLTATTTQTVLPPAAAAATTGACPAPKAKKKKSKGKAAKDGKGKKPARQRLSGGGFRSFTATVGSPVPIFADSHLSTPGWLASAINGGSAGSMPVTSQGICF